MEHIAAIEERLASPIQEATKSDLATRRKNEVSRLLRTRDDLRGVFAFADIVEESVRWSA